MFRQGSTRDHTPSGDPRQERVPAWRDTARPLGQRVELLLAEMTRGEKVAQLGSRWVRRAGTGSGT
jgi:hypothetical protein